MPETTYYSADMVRELIDENRAWPRYETVHGELLVSPAPRLWHQEVVGRLYRALADYLDRQPVGHVFASPSDISWSDDTLVQPDVFVVPIEQARTMEWRGINTLLLAIEVLSPSSLRADRFTKRRLYQEIGIPRYWVIDADAKSADIWTPESRFPAVERQQLTWAPPQAATPFTVGLESLLRPL